MGAHPSRPSTAVVDGAKIELDELIQRGPEAALGTRVVDNSGAPCLSSSRSCRGHPPLDSGAPSKRKAELGSSARISAGSRRCRRAELRDLEPQTEMAVALTHFEAQCGSDPSPESSRTRDSSRLGEFKRSLDRLERDPSRVECRFSSTRYLMRPASASAAPRLRVGGIRAISIHAPRRRAARGLPMGP